MSYLNRAPWLLAVLATATATLSAQTQAAPLSQPRTSRCARDLGLLPVEITKSIALRPRGGTGPSVRTQRREVFFYCSRLGSDFVVSLWPGGTAYLVARGAARQLSAPPPYRLSQGRENCIAAELRREWERPAASPQQFEQRMLQLARRNGISAVTLSDVNEIAKHRDPGPCREPA